MFLEWKALQMVTHAQPPDVVAFENHPETRTCPECDIVFNNGCATAWPCKTATLQTALVAGGHPGDIQCASYYL